MIAESGDTLLELNPDHRFVSGSLYKLFVLWQTQVAIRAGRLSDDTKLVLDATTDDSAEDGYALGDYGDTITVAAARRLMIVESNNTAAWLLAQRLGWAEIQRTLRANGFPLSEMSPETLTTPREVTRFFAGVLGRDLDPALQASDYALMLDLLKAQEINTMLPQGWPDGTVFAHKTGTLDGVTHDAGVLLLPDGRAIYVTVMTEGDYDASLAFMREAAQLIWADLGLYPAAPAPTPTEQGAALPGSRPRL